jgi:transposase
VWALVVTAASVQDRDGALRALAQMEPFAERLQVIFADGNYSGHLPGLVKDLTDWLLQVVKKPEGQKGFTILPKRWIVERTLAWFGKYRRMSKDYEFLPNSSEAMIRWAMVNRMLRHLAPT